MRYKQNKTYILDKYKFLHHMTVTGRSWSNFFDSIIKLDGHKVDVLNQYEGIVKGDGEILWVNVKWCKEL